MLIFFVFDNLDNKSKFEYLYNKYKKLLLHKANGILGDYYLAEDAVSETYIRIYKNLHKIDDVDSNKTIAFLVIITKNVAINILNKNKNIVASDFEDNEYKDDFNLEEFVISENTTEDMLAIVDSLKEEWKSCFLLMYSYNMSYREIGSILNITEDAVAVRIHRAKKRLAELLRKGEYI